MKTLCTTMFAVLLMSFVTMSAVVIDEGAFEHSTGDGANYDFVTISLGWNCQPAGFMRTHKIRFFAAPFDWCITPYASLYKVIKNSFRKFLKKENLIPYAWNNSDINGILDQESGIFYNHDFPDNTFDAIARYYQPVYDKYKRRIDRLFKQLGSGKHVYFIRYLDITKAQACELCQLLKDQFPQTSFTLIAIGNRADEFEQDWGVPHIKNFFVYCEHGINGNTMPEEENPFWKELYNAIRSGVLR